MGETPNAIGAEQNIGNRGVIMSAPFRIRRPDQGLRTVGRGGDEDFKFYLDRLLKMIPGEALGLYLVGRGFIPKDQSVALIVWTVVCLAGVIAIKAYGTPC